MALISNIVSQTVGVATHLYEEHGEIVHRTRLGWLIVPTVLLGYFAFADGHWPVTVALVGFVLFWVTVSVIEGRNNQE